MEQSGHDDPSELEILAGVGIDPDWIVGVPHPELLRRFHRAVNGAGVGDEGEQLVVVCWRDMLLAVLSLGSPAEAVGALGLGTEAIVAALYAPILRGVARHGGLHPRDSVFFSARESFWRWLHERAIKMGS